MKILRPGRALRALGVMCCLAAMTAAPAPAQAIVGYGALTGASSVGAAGGKAAGAATARTMRRVGGALSAASGAGAGEPVKRTAEGVVRLGFGNAESTPNSIVVFAAWGAEHEPPVRPAPSAAPVANPASGATAPQTADAPAPSALKRGAKIEDVIAEFGRPALVVNGPASAGYDRKYVFRSPGGERRAVLVLGDRVVDWGGEH